MISIETALLRLFVSIVLGAVIGFEREYRNKSAGLRTMTLICMGSCLFTLVSIILSNGTTDRIASTVVTGIGFIGAGVIFKNDKGVDGLTTAATIWITAAIGMASATGMYWEAGIATVVVVITLALVIKLESVIENINMDREYMIVVSYREGILEEYEKRINEHGLNFKRENRTRKSHEVSSTWQVKGSRKNHDRFISNMLKDDALIEFHF